MRGKNYIPTETNEMPTRPTLDTRTEPVLISCMDQFFLCAVCGEENELFIDPTGGDKQEFVQDCRVCCHPNVIRAHFNYYSNEYDIEVYCEDVG